MSDPISLDAARSARDQPDPEYVRRDDFGRPMFCFILEYEMDGGTWAAELWAYSMVDAKARVDAMKESLVLRGQLFGRSPA